MGRDKELQSELERNGEERTPKSGTHSAKECFNTI
jgi:hypothetical protein